jgi:hypothetical protein
VSWQTDLSEVFAQMHPSEFDRLIARLNRRRTDYASDALAYPDVRERVISAADRDNWARDLVREALSFNPRNPRSTRLRAFRDAYPELAPPLLKDGTIRELQIGLESAFPTYADLTALTDTLSIEGGVTLDDIVERRVDQPPPGYTRRLITWLDERALIPALLDALASRSHPVLMVSVERVRHALKRQESAAGYRIVNPVKACLINDRVFLDRAPLRRVLERLSTPRTPIVAVNGPSASGKSHSLELIQYVVSRIKGVDVASIDLKKEAKATFEPSLLARSVLFQVGRDTEADRIPKKEGAASTARWGRELGEWLVGLARRSGALWVIVLDGFYHPDLHSETREMVRELVARAAMPGAPLRIVLLHYSDDLLPVDVSARVTPEQLGSLTREEVLEFLTTLADQEGLEIEPGGLEDIVANIVSAAGLDHIKPLADEVQRWVDDLRQPDTEVPRA